MSDENNKSKENLTKGEENKDEENENETVAQHVPPLPEVQVDSSTNEENTMRPMLSPLPSKNNQLIPIAVFRKTPITCPPPTDSSGTGGSLIQIIAGTNKVAPATVDDVKTATTVDAAVLMLVPKKSEFVCVDVPEQDVENNRVDLEPMQQAATCSRSRLEDIKPSQSYDSYEEVCRICHDNPSKLELISPCLCKGSMSKVHRTCLERWLGESAKNTCEICGYEYNTVRKPKYTGCMSFWQWIRHPLSPADTRNLFFDIACFFILTPLAAISSWLCVVGAQHYTFGEERRRKQGQNIRNHDIWSNRADLRADASNATWTSVGLLSLTGTLLVAYTVWLFVAIKYHIQAWTDWQQRNFTVTIVPFEDGCMGRPPAPREREPSQRVGDNNNAVNNNNADDIILSALLWESANGSMRGLPLDSVSSSVLAALAGRGFLSASGSSSSADVEAGNGNEINNQQSECSPACASASAPANVGGG